MIKESRKRGKKHLKSKTKLFERWASMHARCKPFYKNSRFYFDKGIHVCLEWGTFPPFGSWAILNGFSKELQLDRIDNDKGYSPDNCRWVTGIINNANRSNTIIVNYDGEEVSLTILCARLDFTKQQNRNIRDRVMRGWSIEDAINKPIKTFNHKFV
jgi:hypothetical protein